MINTGGRSASSGMGGGRPHTEYDQYGKESPITVYPDVQPFEDSLVKETLYHGSVYDNITEFSTEGATSSGGIFFTDEKEQALFEPEYKKHAYKNSSPTLYNVFLNIRNPLRVSPDEILAVGNYNDPKTESVFIRKAKKLGRDSVIFDNYGTMNYVVFSPEQIRIKSKRPTTNKMIWGF